MSGASCTARCSRCCTTCTCFVSVLVLVDASDVYERRELHREVLKVLHYHSDKTILLVLNKVM